MGSPGGSREYAVADERCDAVKKENADAMMRRAICDWGDYVSRWSFVEDVTGDLAVVIESATHDEVLVVSSVSDLDTYMVYDPETLDVFIKKLKKARRRILKRA